MRLVPAFYHGKDGGRGMVENKVYLFFSDNCDELQLKINQWFSQNPRARMKFVTQSQGPMPGNKPGLIISVFYEEEIAT
jgi:hypothetical protein